MISEEGAGTGKLKCSSSDYFRIFGVACVGELPVAWRRNDTKRKIKDAWEGTVNLTKEKKQAGNVSRGENMVWPFLPSKFAQASTICDCVVFMVCVN